MRKVYLFITVLFFNSYVYSQDITDTIFYDNKWAICEKPIADYYRLSTLRVKDHAFFVGEVKDYYLNGQLEMKGIYNEKGIPNGDFSWYYGDGKLAKQGKFENNVMKGPWLFYDRAGKLSMILNCFDEKNFQPVIICDKNGDSVFNENGNFRIVVKDYPHVFSSKDYILEGEIKDGVKSGSWKYSIELPSFPKENLKKHDVIFEEIYKNGRLKKTIGHGGLSNASDTYNQSAQVIHLYPAKLTTTESLTTDFIFLDDDQQKYKLGNLLINKISPVRNITPVSTRSNFSGYIFCISSALKKREDFPGLINYVPDKGYFSTSYKLTTAIQDSGDKRSLLNLEADISFAITATGMVDSVKIGGSLGERTNTAITYYLSRLRHLFVCADPTKRKGFLQIKREQRINHTEDQSSIITDLTLEEKMSKEELQEFDLKEREKINSSLDQDRDIVFTKVEITPVYPGGQPSWKRYLERNLQYPAGARSKGIEGKVVIQFIVDKEGNVSDVQPVSGDPLLVEEGVRLIKKSGKWMPAIQNGHQVKAYIRQTIEFKLD